MPEESCIILEYMSQNNWLYSYRKAEGIRKALEGMSRRMKYYFPMDNAVAELEKNPEVYNHNFLEFFPLLVQHIAPFKG